jgi:hypothetical protein
MLSCEMEHKICFSLSMTALNIEECRIFENQDLYYVSFIF